VGFESSPDLPSYPSSYLGPPRQRHLFTAGRARIGRPSRAPASTRARRCGLVTAPPTRQKLPRRKLNSRRNATSSNATSPIQTVRHAIDYVAAYGRMVGLVNNAGANDCSASNRFARSLRRSLQQNLVHTRHGALCAAHAQGLARPHRHISPSRAHRPGGTSAYAAQRAQLALTREWAADLPLRRCAPMRPPAE